MVQRTNRLSGEFRKEISDIIMNQMKDPRLSDVVSVTGVQVTKDLRYAKVYISVLGDEEQKDSTIMALKSAAGFIRHEVGQRIRLRYTPELQFHLDTSIEHGAYMSKLIDDTLKKDRDEKNGV